MINSISIHEPESFQDDHAKEKSIIISESFALAPVWKIKEEDETLPHVITRKF